MMAYTKDDNVTKLGIVPVVDTSKFAFGFHYSIADKTAYPQAQWDQYVRRQPITWPGLNGEPEVTWK